MSIRFCPTKDCRLTNNGPTRLLVLNVREGRGAFRPYEAPGSSTKIYACPKHGLHWETRDGRLIKAKVPA